MLLFNKVAFTGLAKEMLWKRTRIQITLSEKRFVYNGNRPFCSGAINPNPNPSMLSHPCTINYTGKMSFKYTYIYTHPHTHTHTHIIYV
jgi:hypothetical protein